jgi:hypothetical protein
MQLKSRVRESSTNDLGHPIYIDSHRRVPQSLQLKPPAFIPRHFGKLSFSFRAPRRHPTARVMHNVALLGYVIAMNLPDVLLAPAASHFPIGITDLIFLPVGTSERPLVCANQHHLHIK